MLNVIVLSVAIYVLFCCYVFMLSVVMLNVVMLIGVAPNKKIVFAIILFSVS